MLRRLGLAVAAALLVGAAASSVQAQSAGDGMAKLDRMPVDAFGYLPTFELSPTFNYLSSYGPTDRHDDTSLSGDATFDLEGAYLSCETGTSEDSECDVRTVELGRYEAGREARWGLGIVPETLPTGDAVMEFGAYTDANGSYFRIHDSDGDGHPELCTIYESGGTETERCGLEKRNGEIVRTDTPFQGAPRPSGFDPFDDGWVAVGHTNWYGIGGTSYLAYTPEREDMKALKAWHIHTFVPAKGQAYVDPNLPVRFRTDVGTSGSNVELQVGGRRFDIAGKGAPEQRLSGEYRVGQSVTAEGNGGSLTPLVCLRREAVFPAGTGRENTVTAYIESWDVSSDEDALIWVLVDPTFSGTTPTWNTPSQHNDDESAIESAKNVDGLSSWDAATGPYFVEGGSFFSPNKTTNEGLRVHFPGTDPVCIAGLVPGSADATMTSIIRSVTGW